MLEIRKQEAKWQTIWNQYIREMRERGTPIYGYFELKQTSKNSLPFSKIEIHQYDGLQALEKSGFVWKFSDQDMREKPIDSQCTPPLPSYLVIKFPDAYYMIRIGEIVKLRENGGISITLEEAKKVAEKIVILGGDKKVLDIDTDIGI